MVAVMYVYRETEKMTLDLYEPLLNLMASRYSLKVQGVYADGFQDAMVPRGGWDNLIQDIKTEGITHILMTNFSKWDGDTEAFMRDIQPLINAGLTLVVSQAGFINGGVINDAGTFAQALIVLESAQYYRDVKGLRVRAGQKATNKNVGNTPYGMKNVNGTLKKDAEAMENIRYIMQAHLAGIPRGDIARSLGPDFNYDKVYHVIEYWQSRLDWREG